MLKTLLFLFVAILASMQVAAQYPINSVDKIFIEGDSTRRLKDSGSLRSNRILDGDILVFDVPGIGEYITLNHLRTSEVRLMIDTCDMAEFPAFIEDFEAGLVKFRYFEDELSSQHRQAIYSNGKEVKKLQLGLKIGNEPIISYSEKRTFYFSKVKLWSQIGYGLIVGFILFFISLIVFFPSMLKSDLETVKMDIPDADKPKLTKEQIKEIRHQASYSFGKTQMVFWTFIIVSGFIYIWGFTDQLNSINTTALFCLE